MKRMTKIAAAVGIVLGLGLGATALNAHPYGGGHGWGMGGGGGHMMGYGGYGPGPRAGMGPGFGPGAGCDVGFGRGPGFGPGAADGAGEFVEDRLAGVKSELKITPEQENAWNAYVEEAKQQAESMRKLMITMHGSRSASLPERIELRNQIWKQRQEQSETLAKKVNDLYAVLSTEQKAVADQYLGGFGPRAAYGPRGRYR